LRGEAAPILNFHNNPLPEVYLWHEQQQNRD
jgi:hypothetical protein